MNYSDWLSSIPSTFKSDPLWRMEVYRQALLLGDIAWHDATKLSKDRRTTRIADQLYRATGKMSTNISEGYSRKSGKDQARFYEYALGSTRETRDWYYKGRHVLGEAVVQHRIALCVHIIRQLLTMIPQVRGQSIREETAEYKAHSDEMLLENIPF